MQKEKISVTKEFTFDMAHALHKYEGPCKNIHGHTYKLQVTVLGHVDPSIEGKTAGLVVDFGSLKAIVSHYVVNKFDHSLVLNEFIPASLRASACAISEKVIFTPFQPTCENLLIHFKNLISPVLADAGLCLKSVKLYETPTSWAEWCKADQE
jgi:6-pyruvoyltetrahydropterin/6-carboxytetrahydropterin synthase